MDKEEFLDVTRQDWWFVEPSDDSALNELRDRLGATLGYQSDRDWYTKKECLETLWPSIEGRNDLVTQLDDASDADRRKGWIETILQTKASEQESAQPSKAAAAAGLAASVAETGPGQAESAAPKKSLFGKKSSDSSASVAEPAAAEAPAGPEASVASEAAAPPEAPTAPRSPFGKKAADVAAAEEAVPAAEAPAAEAPAAPVEHVDVDEFKKEISVLLENPSIPLNAEDLDELAADPEFDQKLAEATAAFAAELASEGDEDEWDEDDEEELEPVEG